MRKKGLGKHPEDGVDRDGCQHADDAEQTAGNQDHEENFQRMGLHAFGEDDRLEDEVVDELGGDEHAHDFQCIGQQRHIATRRQLSAEGDEDPEATPDVGPDIGNQIEEAGQNPQGEGIFYPQNAQAQGDEGGYGQDLKQQSDEIAGQ